MKNLKVSVIIPAYNVSNYIGECIDSILSQSYSNLEVIIVDDGSTDNTAEICKAFKDSRIRYFKKENGGVSSARNYGLDCVQGACVLFVDSDDFLEKNMIEVLVDKMVKSNSDISVCGAYKYYSDGRKIENQQTQSEIILDKLTSIKWIYDFDHYGSGLWNKLFRVEVLKDIRFPIGKVAEDYSVMYKVFYRANKIIYDSIPLYNYRQRQSSLTKRKKTSFDVLEAIENYVEFSREKEPKLLKNSIYAYTFSCLGVYNTILKNKDKKSELKNLKKKIYSNYSIAIKEEKKRKRKIQLWIFRYLNFLYPIVYKIYMLKERYFE